MKHQKQYFITQDNLSVFKSWLVDEEKAASTVKKYTGGVKNFGAWLGGAAVTKAAAIDYKHFLHKKRERKVTGVNADIAALNSFFSFMNWGIKIKPFKIQKSIFRGMEEELTTDEYFRLLEAAKNQGGERLNLILQTLCATGIRVSELPYVTKKAVSSGSFLLTGKGKTRVVFLPKKLRPLLLSYSRRCNIEEGSLFLSRRGKRLNRSNIWSEMKRLCAAADVEPSKVFPHNLRRLFARHYYNADKDIVRLADVLGHSSIDTTRIYLMESGVEHRRCVDSLELVRA